MKEIIGNIWDQKDADAICVTTNGVIKSNGQLVMGKGIALEAAKRFPDLPRVFGRLVNTFGNNVYPYIAGGFTIFSFPTKHHWKDNSDIELIKKSAQQLVERTVTYKHIYLTRPGCGCGGLEWQNVRNVLDSIFDDRFIVVERI